LGKTFTRPFQFGAPGGRSGKGSTRGPFTGTLSASSLRVVLVLALFGAGSGRSLAFVDCHALPSLFNSWLSFGALYNLKAVFWSIMSRRRSMGRMFSSWCRGSRGVVRKVPDISFTASFCTICSFLTSPICLPVYHSWHPYVRTGRQMALNASLHFA
jgi:hypothetical protein